MNRLLAAVVVALLVAVGSLGAVVVRQRQQIAALELRLTVPTELARDAAGEPVLSDADKRRLDAAVEREKRWNLEYEYLRDRVPPIAPAPQTPRR